MGANMWKRGAAQVFNWTVDLQASPLAITAVTDTNVVDTTSTAVNANTPGFVLDWTGKKRISQTGPSIVLAAFGSATGGTGGVHYGIVKIKDSTGAVVASLTNQWLQGAVGAWFQTSPIQLPSGTTQKYDVTFQAGAAPATFHLNAVSAWEYET